MSLFHSHSHFQFKGSPSFFCLNTKTKKQTNKQTQKRKNTFYFANGCSPLFATMFRFKEKAKKKTENKLTKQI
jgi:hypothetical protein